MAILVAACHNQIRQKRLPTTYYEALIKDISNFIGVKDFDHQSSFGKSMLGLHVSWNIILIYMYLGLFYSAWSIWSLACRTKLSNTISWKTKIPSKSNFYWSLWLRVQLSTRERWFAAPNLWQTLTSTNDYPVHCHVYQTQMNSTNLGFYKMRNGNKTCKI